MKRLIWLLGLLAACDDGASTDKAPADAPIAPLVDATVFRPLDAGERPGDDFGQACDGPEDCSSGFCVVTRGTDRVCTRRCGSDADCPDDWLCRQIVNSGADVTFACIPREAPCAGADLQTDPAHCGDCDNVCDYPAATPLCVGGACAMGPCLAGAHDLDGDPANGCEYACLATRDGVEACDEIDNDCDGRIDEGFDLATDAAHCGACATPCRPPNAVGACVGGACTVGECIAPFADADGDPANGCEDGCQPTRGGIEACDGIDNDCDGPADEGFDLQTDAEHCGACDVRCARDNAEVACEAGACRLVECRAGFFDANDDPEDGCEVGCQPTFGGVERCDLVDNDCDGAVDEGLDLSADPQNCGACGVACARPNAQTACVAAACRFAGCLDGFFDADGDPANGCEVGCQPSFDGVERCDLVDNDCDGAVDEGLDLSADPLNCGACGVVCARPNTRSACVDARCQISGCVDGFFDRDRDPENGCEVGCQPTFGGEERCDGVDNDCDGRADEGVDLARDSANCGACGVRCARPNAIALCVAGACQRQGCAPGFVDLDGDDENGCEYACVRAGAEVCNAADDDCDGAIDEGFDLLADALNCGRCGVECARPNAFVSCDQGRCAVDACAPGFIDLNGRGDDGCELACVPRGAEACNARDDDCDGSVDEDFAVSADVNNCGACGFRCDLANATALCADGRCRVDACAPGFVDADGVARTGCECAVDGAERCDGADNDCDGRVDEGFNLQGDVAHCGACGAACRPPRGAGRCVVGACEVARCDPGFVDRNGDVADGCECAVAAETCDGADQDCDGRVDEGFVLASDPANCGACGRVCVVPRATAACVNSQCRVDRCQAGFVDLDGQPGNGCECAVAAEACNGRDDDCDGRTDEAFDLQNDVANCGACGRGCAADNGAARCVGGECAIDGCAPGFADRNGDPADGCECRIQAEICNGADDDCDARTDEGFDLQGDVRHCGGCGQACDLPQASEICVAGRCRIDGCDGGFVDRDGQPGNGCECAVRAEACNGADDDCDARTDEGFDLQNDVANCGACGRRCALAGAQARCVAGACAVAACDDGFADRDGLPANGCECAIRAEVCNGGDDDCDARTDEGFDLQNDVANCGDCGLVCALPHAVPRCARGDCVIDRCAQGFGDADGDDANGCECPIANGGVESCNGTDEDCDGAVDETFDLQNDPNHCGNCARVCQLPHAIADCRLGGCVIAACDAGWRDANNLPGDGCEAAVVAFPYPGTYDFAPRARYSCNDVFFGDVAFSMDVAAFVFAIGGNQLSVSGGPALMTQGPPAPVDGSFAVRGVIDGGAFGCTETYTLTGDFDDNDNFTAVYRVSFAGFACDLTDCVQQTWNITGVRR